MRRGTGCPSPQVQGTALSIRQGMALGAEDAPAATERGIRRFLLGRARRTHARALATEHISIKVRMRSHWVSENRPREDRQGDRL